MEYLGDTPEKRNKMQTAWKAAWYILERLGLRPEPVEEPTITIPVVCPPDPEAEYERLYRRGEMEIVVMPEPWESEDEWTAGYIKLRQDIRDFDPYLEETNNGTTRLREERKESTDRQGTSESVES